PTARNAGGRCGRANRPPLAPEATLLMMLMPKVEYTAMLLGATGNVGGHILHLLVQSPLCNKVVVVTRRNVAEFANPKVQQVVVNMDGLEEELAPHAKGVDIALAAFSVGKGSAKMAD